MKLEIVFEPIKTKIAPEIVFEPMKHEVKNMYTYYYYVKMLSLGVFIGSVLG